MTIAIDPTEEFAFVSLEDLELPEPDRTIWNIIGLDVKQRTRLEGRGATAKLDANTFDPDSIEFHEPELLYEAVRAGLKGCENFRGEETEEHPNGEPIPFERDKTLNVLGKNITPPTDKFLSRIPPNVFNQIGLAIRAGTRLSPAEGKA